MSGNRTSRIMQEIPIAVNVDLGVTTYYWRATEWIWKKT